MTERSPATSHGHFGSRLAAALVLAALAPLGACEEGGNPGPPPPVIDALVAAGSMGLPRSALPPFYTHCAEADPNTGEPYLAAGETCTLTFTREFGGDAVNGYTLREDIYVYAMGALNQDATPLPWMQDGGHYCTFHYSIVPSAVEGYPESDLQRLDMTYEAIEDDPVLQPCSTHIFPGGTVYEYAYRSASAGVFLFNAEYYFLEGGSTYAFSGLYGVEGFGCMDVTGQNPCPNNQGYMQFYEVCDPVNPGTGGPGYCQAACRLFEEGNGLPMCDKARVHEYPANGALVDPGFASAHPDVFGD